MKYRRTKKFRECYDELPEEIKEKAKKAFRLFQENPDHPSLRIRKMVGHKDIWEGHVDIHYCFTFHYEKDEKTDEKICVFRVIGTHKIYDNP